jgi:tetratricopeptide (TPR) repeat protein
MKSFILNPDMIHSPSPSMKLKSNLSLWCLLAWMFCFLCTMPLSAQENQAAKPDEKKELKPDVNFDNRYSKIIKAEELKTPSTQELLTGAARDWILLTSDRITASNNVLIVDPIYPRPDTVAKLTAEAEDITKQIGEGKRKKELTPVQEEELSAERESLNYLTVNAIIEGHEDKMEYRLNKRFVSDIIYFEDMILRRIDEEIAVGNLNASYELLVFLTKRLEDPKPAENNSKELWKGMQQREFQLLFAEAQLRIEAGEYESALMALEDLYTKAPNFARIEAAISRTCNALITKSIDAGDYRQARFYMARLARIYPNHEVYQSAASRLQELSNKFKQEAQTQWSQGTFSAAIESYRVAIDAMPRAAGLIQEYRKFAREYQILRVGVLELAKRPDADEPLLTGTPLYMDAETRRNQLNRTPLFRINHVKDGRPHYSTTLLEEWQPVDLGRTWILHMRPTRETWDIDSPMSGYELGLNLLARLNPESPTYDERFDYFVREINFPTPNQITIQLDHIPLEGEQLFAKWTLNDYFKSNLNSSSTPNPVVLNRFSDARVNPSMHRFERLRKQPRNASEMHVAEIQEWQYPDYPATIQALNRGEVDALPDMDPILIPQLKKDARYYVIPYALPTTHFLQFHPQSRYFPIREYRKAVMYALDRQKILHSVIPPEVNGFSYGKLLTAPFSSRSEGYSLTLKQAMHEPSAALVLGLTAQKKAGEKLPPLRILVSKEPTVQKIAQEIIANLELVKIEAVLVTADQLTPQLKESTDPGWDVVYRHVRIYDPKSELWPMMTFSPTAALENLKVFPEWLRNELMEWDQASDWKTSAKVAQQIQEDLLGEAYFIPLFEIQDHFICRKQIRGIPPNLIHAYDRIEQWSLEPFLPEEFTP